MRIFFILFSILLLNACAPRLIPAPTQISTSALSETVTPTADPKAEKIADLAIKDLSTRLGLGQSSVLLRSTESILWESTALGCLRPGEVYAQQTVPGYRLFLKANGREYIYHT